MDIDEARTLAEGLMRAHQLRGWQLVFDRAKARAGVCRYSRREIGLSRVLTELHSPELVRATVLHEIAHALVGSRHGHDASWHAKALAIGGDGERCMNPDAPRATAPWVGTCARGHEVTRHRRPTHPSSCSRCSPTFDVAHLLLWRLHGRRLHLSVAYLAELAIGTAGGREAPAAAHAADVADVADVAAIVDRGSPPRAWLALGTRVVLGGSGKYTGLSGRIEKRGRTRYHVRTPIGTVTAPFALVHAVSGQEDDG